MGVNNAHQSHGFADSWNVSLDGEPEGLSAVSLVPTMNDLCPRCASDTVRKALRDASLRHLSWHAACQDYGGGKNIRRHMAKIELRI